VLRADLNWRVATHRIADTLTLQLRYSPAGDWLTVALRRFDALWWRAP